MPYLKGGVEVLIEGVSVLVMAIFLARHPGDLRGRGGRPGPAARRPLARAILRDLNVTLRAWVIGQIIAMVLLAALTTLGLWALGMPYFLAFGVFAGVAAIVPFFGVLLSTVLPALFALGAFGVTKALLVAALGVVVHLIEANFVAPVVMERQVNLPPVITIAGVLLIGKLFGLGGLIIAVPILALVMILVRHILLGEVYGDPVSAADAQRRRPRRRRAHDPTHRPTPDRMAAPRFLIVADGDFAPDDLEDRQLGHPLPARAHRRRARPPAGRPDRAGRAGLRRRLPVVGSMREGLALRAHARS